MLNDKQKKRIYDTFESILIGSVIAFLTFFLEGTLDWLKGFDNNILGGVIGAIRYGSKYWS